MRADTLAKQTTNAPEEGRLGHLYIYNPGHLTEVICEVLFRYCILTFGMRKGGGNRKTTVSSGIDRGTK